MTKDLHSFLQEYERDFPAEVVHIEKEVDARYEITALVSKLEKQKKFPILFFHRVKTSRGIPSLPLIVFLLSSRKRLAHVLESGVEGVGVATFERLGRQIDPVVVTKSAAPVKQIVSTGDDIDLTEYPPPCIMRWTPVLILPEVFSPLISQTVASPIPHCNGAGSAVQKKSVFASNPSAIIFSS